MSDRRSHGKCGERVSRRVKYKSDWGSRTGNNCPEAVADGIGAAAGRSGQNCNPDIPT